MIWNLKENMRKNWDFDFGYEHHHHHHHHHHLDHHCCFKMSRIIDFEMSQKNDLLTYPPPISLSPPPISLSPPSAPPPPPPPSSLSSNGSKISPAVLFIIVILAVLFFVSGLLHLLVRFLIKHPSTSTPPQSNNNNNNNTYATEMSESETLQRQLQQLFHLHDSGLDQAFIDALPVFHYKEIVGLKEPFDCAVCLCEFSVKDKLRLLPICSHAFHINCIDTWLLTNSTCPLCRGALFTPEFSMENPMFNFDDSRENGGFGLGLGSRENCTKRIEIEEIVADKGVLSVRLGKFRRLDTRDDEFYKGETSSSNLDARRCFSMGSYQYIVNESNFQVSMRRDQDNVRDENHVSVSIDVDDSDLEGKKISSGTKRDSYSVSKIWLWSKKGKYAASSLDTDLPSWMPRRDGL